MLPTRRTLAITFADIAGYTTMLQENESAASKALKQYKALIHELIPAHQGDIRQFYGDGCLMAFDSAEQAIRCAEGLQLACMKAEIPVRIGVHMGEVV
ncbi:MAG: adenylate/guanylate cyclase domain-containing protein, partial [Bacteroidia bacterium]|nr:adenylate/guanylate cyclase domain-containing protein [Bacteroidia bacterium]